MTNKLSTMPIAPMTMYMIFTARLLMWATYSVRSSSADEDVVVLFQISFDSDVFSIAAEGFLLLSLRILLAIYQLTQHQQPSTP